MFSQPGTQAWAGSPKLSAVAWRMVTSSKNVHARLQDHSRHQGLGLVLVIMNDLM